MVPSSHTVRVGRDHRIELVLPGLAEGMMVTVRVEQLEVVSRLAPREPGSAKGRIRMLSNFDDPIEEFEEYRQ